MTRRPALKGDLVGRDAAARGEDGGEVCRPRTRAPSSSVGRGEPDQLHRAHSPRASRAH